MKLSFALHRTTSFKKNEGRKNNKPQYDWSKKVKRRKGWKA